MAVYEIVLKEIETETKSEFNKDTNSFREVKTEKEIYLFHLRIDGYKPNIVKEVIDFAVEKM